MATLCTFYEIVFPPRFFLITVSKKSMFMCKSKWRCVYARARYAYNGWTSANDTEYVMLTSNWVPFLLLFNFYSQNYRQSILLSYFFLFSFPSQLFFLLQVLLSSPYFSARFAVTIWNKTKQKTERSTKINIFNNDGSFMVNVNLFECFFILHLACCCCLFSVCFCSTSKLLSFLFRFSFPSKIEEEELLTAVCLSVLFYTNSNQSKLELNWHNFCFRVCPFESSIKNLKK